MAFFENEVKKKKKKKRKKTHKKPPMKRRALKCLARPRSLYIIELTRQQTGSVSGQDPEIRRQEGEH